MWTAIAGMATNLIGNAISSSQAKAAAREAYNSNMRYLNDQERDNKTQYQYNQAASRAKISATLNQGAEQMREAINDNYNRGVIMGDSAGRGSAGLQEAAMAEMGKSAREGAVLAEEASRNATDTYYANQRQINNARREAEMNYQNGIAQQSQIAGQAFATIGNGLINASLSSRLNTGKGLFENAFGKTGTSGKVSDAVNNNVTMLRQAGIKPINNAIKLF